MPIVIIFIFSIFTLLFVSVGYLLWRNFKRKRIHLVDYSTDKISYEFLSQNDIERKEERLTEGNYEFLKKNNIKKVFLAHGTFVGEDPFHFIELMEELLPKKMNAIFNPARKFVKKGQNFILKDFGNFNSKYEELLSAHGDIEVTNYVWSSGNHHYARVAGMIKLLKQITDTNNTDSIMLIGHSHAGQLFSLLTQTLHNGGFRRYLVENLPELFESFDVNEQIKKLRKTTFYIITLGTPPRYKWYCHSQFKVFHFINNRLSTIYAKDFSGLLTTKNGDYIQQLGVAGSDFISPVEKENEMNKKFDQYFGVGANFSYLKSELNKLRRTHNYGHHFFVDYGDASDRPNFLLTAFGHAIYTKTEFLSFHLTQVQKILEREGS